MVENHRRKLAVYIKLLFVTSQIDRKNDESGSFYIYFEKMIWRRKTQWQLHE